MENGKSVIVRAFGDEPCKLVALPGEHGEVLVYRNTPEVAIPYPAGYVYEWDERLFEALVNAYEGNRFVELASLWRNAKGCEVHQATH